MHVSAAAQQADPIVVRFRQMDRDGDGKLIQAETTPFPALQRMLEGADKDGDGQISLDEARAHLVGRARPQRPATTPRSAPPMMRSNGCSRGWTATATES
jgi:Ca2+-binding EF-hand superfamily protein